MREVTCHTVGEQQIAHALEDIHRRVFHRYHGLLYDDLSLKGLREMRDDLLDHAAARIAVNPEIALDEVSRTALLTAAECSLGIMSVGCYPDGDQDIPLPFIGEKLTSEELVFGDDVIDQAPTARTWWDTLAICLVSGQVWEWQRVTGLLLREDYAPAILDGVPYSQLTSASDPADLATMDALRDYLTPAGGHLPRDWPTVPLRRPDADERAVAAHRLDAAGPLTPDQRLLRVLLDDDQRAFEQALAARLTEHRESREPDPAPRTLLPLGPLALAVLAVQVHGWELDVQSGYLPRGILGSPQALREAADADENTLGYWTAK
ncbi:immunity 49 family protein [Streptomyces sp. NPDC001407]|uniref:immunity 49 family protein n=1 Tax=Streptomyces sp. NPDC001407 TaxID=3364573 RepID=UPI0036C764BF